MSLLSTVTDVEYASTVSLKNLSSWTTVDINKVQIGRKRQKDINSVTSYRNCEVKTRLYGKEPTVNREQSDLN
jgi:hypothetical protein